ncbi:MAG: type II toxin-antitoxin system VapC family toxin [Betaproteobacteria bacterium]|nr:type II toxin-antitoxin system VapC family toxin [Betaproteobacteria bacterium]
MGLNAPYGLKPGDRVAVDSAPLIYFLEDHRVLAGRFFPLFEAEAAGTIEIVVSAIAVAEVLAGPLKAGNEALANRFRRAMEAWEIVPVDSDLAVLAARLRAAHGLRLPDAIHAATAISRGSAALVTHDRDFSRLKGLRVIDGSNQRFDR